MPVNQPHPRRNRNAEARHASRNCGLVRGLSGGRLKMRKVFIIGIGAGNPDYITVQAINALNEVDVFFVMDKGREKEDLVRLRKEICQRYVKNKSYRTIEIRETERDRTASSYESGVKAWHEQRAIVYERLIREELGEDERGAFLGCGDASRSSRHSR